MAAETETLHRELNERNVDLLVARRFRPLPTSDEVRVTLEDFYVVVRTYKIDGLSGVGLNLPSWRMDAMWRYHSRQACRLGRAEAFRASGLDYPRTTVVTVPAEVRLSLLASGHFPRPCVRLRLEIFHPRVGAQGLAGHTADGPRADWGVYLKKRTLSPVATLFIDHRS